MFPCSGCKRHIRDTEPACPFCGVEQRAVSGQASVQSGASACVGALALATTMALGLSACSRTIGAYDEGEATTTDDTTESSSSEVTSMMTTDVTTTTETTLGDTDDTASDSNDTSLSFYAGPEPDWSQTWECDPFLQDCPDGEKCVPYASTGGTWDADKCVPIFGDGQPGDPCIYAGAVESTDDCGADSFCWNVMDVDGQSIGTCTPFCQGTPEDPVCPEGSSCLITNEGSITLCIDTCDPITQDCGPGLACYFVNETFNCVWTTQDIPAGEPCGFINDCVGGTGCLPADVFPMCLGSACCAEFCSLANPVCTLQGTECTPFFEQGNEPPEYMDVGVCIAPGA